MFNSYIELLKEKSFSKDESRFNALQLLEMHKETFKRKKVVILELGVDKGSSTKVIVEKTGLSTEEADAIVKFHGDKSLK